MKVLVADDDAEVRDMLRDFLTVEGFEVNEASNGLETLLQVKRTHPDAVILDLRMPRLGGLEALKRIRTFDPKIVVVVLTAETDPGVHGEALGLGARCVLLKPVALPDLVAAIHGQPPAATPAAAAAPAASVTKVAFPEPRAATAQPAADVGRILVIDDDPDVRSVLVDFLTSRSYVVSEAASAVGGIRSLVDAAPDVVLLDIDMPGVSGADALPTIRALVPRASVIMVSASADEALAKRMLAHGAFDYVVKPVDFDYLSQTLDAALAMKNLDG